MTNYDELPVFPLHTVLYPEMPLPLHIFEPRYLAMMEYCRTQQAHFGVVLIQKGSEVGGHALPFSIGTTARLRHCERLSDGRLNVVTTGDSPFRILDIYENRSYLTAKVEALREEASDTITLIETFATASDLFRTYLRSLCTLANRHLGSLQMPSEARELSYAIANALQVPLMEKQSLLECLSTEQRLAREIEILRREVEAQQYLTEIQKTLPNGNAWEISPVNADSMRQLISRN
jgi:Lon protease-like protein